MYRLYIFGQGSIAMLRLPHPKSAGAAIGVNEAMIHQLVHEFYAKVREDEKLGPVFGAHVQNWDVHLSTMCAFWSSVMLMTGSYKGQPMEVHARLPEISDQHFERWLRLFKRTASECCPAEAAQLFIDRSERIAESLKMGIAVRRDRGAYLSAH